MLIRKDLPGPVGRRRCALLLCRGAPSLAIQAGIFWVVAGRGRSWHVNGGYPTPWLEER